KPALAAWWLVGLAFGAQVALTALVERWLAEHGRSRWYALTVGLWAGLVMAVRLDLSEPLCLALVMGGLWALRRERAGAAALLLAQALLAKETALLFVLALLAWAALNRRWRHLALLAAALVPFAVLQALLWVWFGQVGLTTGGY